MNIKNFNEITKISSEIRKIYQSASKNFPSQYAATFFGFYCSFSGPKYENCKRCEFFKKFQVIEDFPVKLNHFEKLHKWLSHEPNYQKYRIGLIKREFLYAVKKGIEPPIKENSVIEDQKSSKFLSEKWTPDEL